MNPVEYYNKLIESEQILKDPQQEEIIRHLQIVYDRLQTYSYRPSLIQKITGSKRNGINGLYIWGDVGVGKTFLMDCFFYSLPCKKKLRIHFHHFMKMIHEQLVLLKNETKPLQTIAKKLAQDNIVICFDELIVHDIADAMLLAGLFKALYQEKICLIFTSNTPPDDLYLKGIQRESFLPAIELIKQHADIINISAHSDYRLRHRKDDTFYYTTSTPNVDQLLQEQFTILSQGQSVNHMPLHIHDRNIKIRAKASGVVWFDFLEICGIPRSQHDYLAIAQQFDAIIISNLTVIQPEQNDLIRSFINLIDVLYDAKKRLIISAEKPIEGIYNCGKMLFEFARTRSRIIEMQTKNWHSTKVL